MLKGFTNTFVHMGILYIKVLLDNKVKLLLTDEK